jgi:hypothetical protein
MVDRSSPGGKAVSPFAPKRVSRQIDRHPIRLDVNGSTAPTAPPYGGYCV